MKKLLVVGLGLLFAVQASVAFAAPAPAPKTTSMEPAISGLLQFNRWLTSNNFSGSAYLNDNALKAFNQSLLWAFNHNPQNPLFYSIDITNGAATDCVFKFGDPGKLKEFFVVKCSEVANGGQGRISPSAEMIDSQKLFGFPALKLRKFVTDILHSPEMLAQVRNVMKGDSRGGYHFSLQKENGELRWTWEVTNSKNMSVKIYGNAGQEGSPLKMAGP